MHDIRLSYSYSRPRVLLPTAQDCPAACPDLGLPQISVSGAAFAVGNHSAGEVTSQGRLYDWAESFTWQRGTHNLKFGSEWEHSTVRIFWAFCEPACMIFYSPQTARDNNIPVPSLFRSVEDVLQLPLATFSVGVGYPAYGALSGEGPGRIGHWRFYSQDAWRVRPRFTLNYGIAFSREQTRFDSELPRPEYLAPIFGGGLTRMFGARNRWSPALGFAWSVTSDNRTVVRAGAGIYQDWTDFNDFSANRTPLSPSGATRIMVPGSLIANPIAGIPGVPVGRSLEFGARPTAFTGAHLFTLLPEIQILLRQRAGGPLNRDLSVRNLNLTKAVARGSALLAPDQSSAYSEHFNLGIQRAISGQLAVSADFVFRQFIHQGINGVDYNHWDRVGGPVIPTCQPGQRENPAALCSLGEINVSNSAGRSHYQGLLVRLDKRFSGRTQFLASYALSSSVGALGPGNRSGFNKDNWFEIYGPLDTDRRHIFNISGVIELPLAFRVSFISSLSSKAPFTAFISPLDLNGDGTNSDVLPGTKVNRFNRGLGKADLVRLVEQFNADNAGRQTARGQPIPRLALPAHYDFGDGLLSQDMRLSRTFKFRERYAATLLGEVFNLFKVANLTGHSGNLREMANFGQPTNRVDQVFGSGGPRAIQLGLKLAF